MLKEAFNIGNQSLRWCVVHHIGHKELILQQTINKDGKKIVTRTLIWKIIEYSGVKLLRTPPSHMNHESYHKFNQWNSQLCEKGEYTFMVLQEYSIITSSNMTQQERSNNKCYDLAYIYIYIQIDRYIIYRLPELFVYCKLVQIRTRTLLKIKKEQDTDMNKIHNIF